MILTFVIGCLFVTLYDLYLISSSPNEYAILYGLNESASHWQFKAWHNYVLWKLAISSIYIFLILLSIVMLKTPGKPVKVLYLIMISGLALWYARYFYLWQGSGFDHYPGFDPYLF